MAQESAGQEIALLRRQLADAQAALGDAEKVRSTCARLPYQACVARAPWRSGRAATGGGWVARPAAGTSKHGRNHISAPKGVSRASSCCRHRLITSYPPRSYRAQPRPQQSLEDARHQLSAEQARTLKLEATVAELNERLEQVRGRFGPLYAAAVRLHRRRIPETAAGRGRPPGHRPAARAPGVCAPGVRVP